MNINSYRSAVAISLSNVYERIEKKFAMAYTNTEHEYVHYTGGLLIYRSCLKNINKFKKYLGNTLLLCYYSLRV